MILKTPWNNDGHLKGTEVERHLTGKAILRYENATSPLVNVRVIRGNQIRKVVHASPGALITFEGHWTTNFEELEFHVLKCSLLQQATFLPGDEAYERPNGLWRLMSAFDTRSDDVEEEKTPFVWH